MATDKNLIETLYRSVARQQALFTTLLPDDLEHAMVDAYLLFRLLDTIEDSSLAPEERAADLEAVADDFPAALEKRSIRHAQAERTPPAYRSLLENFQQIFSFHREQPPNVQGIIEETGARMASGMAKFALREAEVGLGKRPALIEDFSELEEYCTVAAGYVGEMSVRLFDLFGALARADDEVLEAGRALGNFVQIVNVLRDSSSDRERNRSYRPRETAGLADKEYLNQVFSFGRNIASRSELLGEVVVKPEVRTYCATLHGMASLHLTFYQQTAPRILHERIKPPVTLFILFLPPRLVGRFLLYKIRGLFRARD